MDFPTRGDEAAAVPELDERSSFAAEEHNANYGVRPWV